MSNFPDRHAWGALPRWMGYRSIWQIFFLFGLLLKLSTVVSVPTVQAAGFTPGNIVVYRVGSGTEDLANTGNPVFLDEYTPAGTLVQSIALPHTVSGDQNQLIASGTATTEGLLTRSIDGKYLLLTGYATNLGGSSNLPTTTASAVPRVVGRVDWDGIVDTSTVLNFASGSNPRSAVSKDGVGIWVTGGGNGGVRYTTIGSTTVTQINSDITNLRQLHIFGDQLYTSTGSGSVRIGTVGTGTPTVSGQSITGLPDFPTTGEPYGFFLADMDTSVPGHDTLYVADDGEAALSKYALIVGNWVLKGAIGVNADDYRGLTGVVDGTNVTLYVTRKGGSTSNGGGELVTLTDSSGYNGAFSGTPMVIATAASKTAFRGVALAPVAPSPEIDVQGNGQPIASGDDSPSATDHTDFGSALVDGGTVARTFTIANTGAAPLTVDTVSLSGANPGDFSVTSSPASPVSAGDSTTFQITFDPSAAGVRTATVSIVNNDADENPYTFAIGGTGVENVGSALQKNMATQVCASGADPEPNTDKSPLGVCTVTFVLQNKGSNPVTVSYYQVTAIGDTDVTPPCCGKWILNADPVAAQTGAIVRPLLADQSPKQTNDTLTPQFRIGLETVKRYLVRFAVFGYVGVTAAGDDDAAVELGVFEVEVTPTLSSNPGKVFLPAIGR